MQKQYRRVSPLAIAVVLFVLVLMVIPELPSPALAELVQGPSPRSGAATAYDSLDHYGVLFGGYVGGSVCANAWAGDTWIFRNNRWTLLSPSLSPPARAQARLVWDYADGYALLYGGSGCGVGDFTDTWAFKNGSWTNLTASAGVPPGGAFDEGLAYDAAENRVVFFEHNSALGTWVFQSGGWAPLMANATVGIPGPPPRWGPSMVYDPSDGYVVLFGGSSGGAGSPPYSDTWTFRNGNWTNITSKLSVSPPGREEGGFSWNSADNYAILFGGDTDGAHVFSDTWKFIHGAWSNITLPLPPQGRSSPAMSDDPTDGYVLLFGGQTPLSPYLLGDPWRFSQGTWAPITSAAPVQNPTFLIMWAWSSGWIRGLNATVFSNPNPTLAGFRGVPFRVNASWDPIDAGTHDFAIYTAGSSPSGVNSQNFCSLSNTNGCLTRTATFGGTTSPQLHYAYASFTPTIPADDFTGPGTYEYYDEYHPLSTHGRIIVYKNPDLDGTGSVSVDITDIAALALAFGSHGTPTPTPRWNARADLDNNGVIDIIDVATAALYYGQSFPL